MGTETARKLRKNPTEAERVLWQHLRQKSIEGHRFRRQHPMGPYVLDFVCLEEKMVIEVDGGQHAADVVSDANRTFWLKKNGFKVIRFWNHEVLKNLEAVIRVIRLSLSGSNDTPLLSPPPQGGRTEAPL